MYVLYGYALYAQRLRSAVDEHNILNASLHFLRLYVPRFYWWLKVLLVFLSPGENVRAHPWELVVMSC